LILYAFLCGEDGIKINNNTKSYIKKTGKKSVFIKPGFIIRIIQVSKHPSQTRSFRSSGFNRSRSASELLLMQKTKLPRLSTVCSGIHRHLPNDIFGLKGAVSRVELSKTLKKGEQAMSKLRKLPMLLMTGGVDS